MARADGGAEARFGRLVDRFRGDPSVTPPTDEGGGKFGASGLKVDGKLFAMLVARELVVKLPRERVVELVAAGVGKQFDPGHGRLMKEWVSVSQDRGRQWYALAEESRRFVAATRSRSAMSSRPAAGLDR